MTIQEIRDALARLIVGDEGLLLKAQEHLRLRSYGDRPAAGGRVIPAPPAARPGPRPDSHSQQEQLRDYERRLRESPPEEVQGWSWNIGAAAAPQEIIPFDRNRTTLIFSLTVPGQDLYLFPSPISNQNLPGLAAFRVALVSVGDIGQWTLTLAQHGGLVWSAWSATSSTACAVQVIAVRKG